MFDKSDIDRFYSDPFFKDIILDNKIQNKIILSDDLNRLKNVFYLVESILSNWLSDNKLTIDEKQNLDKFFYNINCKITEYIEYIWWKILKVLDLKHYYYLEGKTFYNNDFFELIKNIEKDKDIQIHINDNYKTLLIHNSSWELIWEIWQSEYNDWTFSTNNHLYNYVDKKFRWKWWWKLLYELYVELSKIDNNFILPTKDFTNVVSMVELYKKFWFKVVWKVVYWFDEPLNSCDLSEINQIIIDYKSGKVERKLDYSIIIEK